MLERSFHGLRAVAPVKQRNGAGAHRRRGLPTAFAARNVKLAIWGQPRGPRRGLPEELLRRGWVLPCASLLAEAKEADHEEDRS